MCLYNKTIYGLTRSIMVAVVAVRSRAVVVSLLVQKRLVLVLVEEPGFKNVKNKHFGMPPF